MNGVRRLLGAASTNSPPPNPDSTVPLNFSLKNGPSWPPQSPAASPTQLPAHPPTPKTPNTPSNPRSSLRKSGNTDPSWQRIAGNLDTRDELIVSLMASEAVIDSRQFAILGADEVDELKKEHQVLSSRLEAMSKKLARETKIRDAAMSLSRVNAAHKKVSRQTAEQLEAAGARVEAAQRDLTQISSRAADVHRRLMEHRAAVLSFSVTSLEKKMQIAGDDSGYDSSNRSTLLSPPLPSSPAARFDGAHLFAGHAQALVPKRQLSAEAAAAEIAALEERLNAMNVALADASKKQSDILRDLSLVQLEKQEVETLMGMDLQAAEETIAALELEIPRLEALSTEVKELREAQTRWAAERDSLRTQLESMHAHQARQHDQETRSDVQERALADLRSETERQLADKDAEIKALRDELEAVREDAARDQDERMDDLQRLHEELDGAREAAQEELSTGRSALQSLVSTHGIALFTRNPSLDALVDAVGAHLATVQAKLAEGDAARRKLEDDVRAGFDKREALGRELEEARKERDAARREALDARLNAQATSPPTHMRSMSTISTSTAAAPSGEGTGADAARIISVLQPLWAILPSPEARAAKFGGSTARNFRAGSPTAASPSPSSPNPGGVVSSLSDLDVRSLKTLYSVKDATGTPTSPRGNQFSIEAFAERVRALVADDKALIERLLRFAQAHDLLKKNAERAQKLAQEGTHALETYQKQVRVLEERNAAAAARSNAMQDELDLLHDTIERTTNEKRELERLAADQAAECSALAAANDKLSARALALAEEAAQAPERIRRTLEAQLAEVRKELELAQDEVEAMRTSEQSQRIALLDELNSMQTENGSLRAQLRAAKK